MRIYIAIFFATLATVAAPVPEEASLLGAGLAARFGSVAFVGCVAAALGGIMLGDILGYVVGRFFLSRLLRTPFGEKVLPQERRLWAERMVATHGALAIVLARFLVGLRGFLYFAVGASGFPFARFVAIDGAAGLVEVTGLVAIGFAFGELHVRVGRGVDLLVVAGFLFALAAPVLARRWTRKPRI